MRKSKEKRLYQIDESVPRYETGKAAVKKVKYYSVNTVFTVVFIAAVVVINVLLGVLSNKVNLRLDLTSEGVFTLSDTSKSLISELRDANKKVELIICTDEETARAAASSNTGNSVSVTRYIVETCEEYAREYDGITVSYVDPTYNPSYYNSRGINLNDTTASAVVMAVYSPDTGRYRLIDSTSVSNMEYVAFERRLSAASLFVTKDDLQTVWAITGHGETSIPYYELLLEDNGYILEYANLSDYEEIPEEVSMLVIVNPTRTYDSDDISKIDAFLSNGEALGKHLMVFGDLDMGTNPLLESYLRDEWGVSIGSEVVFDTDSSNIYEMQTAGVTFLTVDYAEETISGSLSSSDAPLRVLLGKTKTVERAFDELDNVRTEALLMSSDTSYSKNIVLYQNGNTYTKEEGDREGPFNIGAISEKYHYDGTSKIASNVVVFGTTSLVDGVFLSNVYGSTSSSADYILNVTKYLVASSGEIDTDILSVDLSGGTLGFESNAQFFLSLAVIVAIIPLVFAGIGIWRALIRKYK